MDDVFIVELPGTDANAELGVFCTMKEAYDYAKKYTRSFGMFVVLRRTQINRETTEVDYAPEL